MMFRQARERIDRFALLADFKMQYRLPTIPYPHCRYFLSANNLVTLFNKNLVVVCIGTQKRSVMLDDNKLSIA